MNLETIERQEIEDLANVITKRVLLTTEGLTNTEKVSLMQDCACILIETQDYLLESEMVNLNIDSLDCFVRHMQDKPDDESIKLSTFALSNTALMLAEYYSYAIK